MRRNSKRDLGRFFSAPSGSKLKPQRAALMIPVPLMIAFLPFQRAFIQSFLRAGIR
jgi:hypothetical protein